jgi:hypothetical protein
MHTLRSAVVKTYLLQQKHLGRINYASNANQRVATVIAAMSLKLLQKSLSNEARAHDTNSYSWHDCRK